MRVVVTGAAVRLTLPRRPLRCHHTTQPSRSNGHTR